MIENYTNKKLNKNEQGKRTLEAFEVSWNKVRLPKLVLLIENNSESLNQFCIKARIGKATLHNIIYGKTNPSKRTKKKISSVFGKDSLDLF